MKNLENFGIQELNAKEIKEISGGNPIWRAFRAIVMAVAAAHELSGCTGHSGTYINQGGVTVSNYDMH